ncbi:MAG: hypothetical protein WD042_18115 [Phycisphaeraceae bacterium]
MLRGILILVSVAIVLGAMAWMPVSAADEAKTRTPQKIEVPTTQPAVEEMSRGITPALLAQLNDDAWQVREAATQRLLGDESLTPEQVEQAYAAAGTPEQRHRLMVVGRHHFIRAMVAESFADDGRGSLGLTQLGVAAGDVPGLDKPAIRVRGTFAGFPAYTRLQVGDLIVAMDGHFLVPTPQAQQQLATQFQQLVIAKKPGDVVKLTLVREGKTLEVATPLASMSGLTDMYDPQNGDLREPYLGKWEAYRQKLEAMAPKPTAPREAK